MTPAERREGRKEGMVLSLIYQGIKQGTSGGKIDPGHQRRKEGFLYTQAHIEDAAVRTQKEITRNAAASRTERKRRERERERNGMSTQQKKKKSIIPFPKNTVVRER